jgi:hypothetical protein
MRRAAYSLLYPMPTSSKKTPKRKVLAPNARDQRTTQVLAIAARLLRDTRASTDLASPTLSILYSGAALQVDKSGTFTASQVTALTGFSEWQVRQQVVDMAEAGYLERVGGKQYYKSQLWALSAKGWQVVKDALQRANGYLSPLYNQLSE